MTFLVLLYMRRGGCLVFPSSLLVTQTLDVLCLVLCSSWLLDSLFINQLGQSRGAAVGTEHWGQKGQESFDEEDRSQKDCGKHDHEQQ